MNTPPPRDLKRPTPQPADITAVRNAAAKQAMNVIIERAAYIDANHDVICQFIDAVNSLIYRWANERPTPYCRITQSAFPPKSPLQRILTNPILRGYISRHYVNAGYTVDFVDGTMTTDSPELHIAIV